MQIQQQMHSSVQQTGQGDQLREGDVYRATINEKVSDSEAKVTIRGRDVMVKFEGEKPEGERVTVQVMAKEGDVTRVRLIAEESPKQSSVSQEQNKGINQSLRQLGVSQPSPELRQAAQMIMEKGVPLTKEAVQELQRFLSSGNKNERLQTVQVVANKRLEVTANHLRSVHEALHGRPLNQLLHELAQEVDKDFKIEAKGNERQSARREARGEMSSRTFEAEVRARLTDQIQQLEKSTKTADRDFARALKEVVNRDSSASRILSEARSLVEERASRPLQQPSGETIRRVNDTLNQLERIQPNTNKEQFQESRNANTIASPPSRITSSSIGQSNQATRAHIVEQMQQLERSSEKASDRQLARAIREVIQHEPSLSRGVEQARALLDQSASRSKSDRPSTQTVQRVNEMLTEAKSEIDQANKTRPSVEQRPTVSDASRSVQNRVEREPTVQRQTEIIRQQLHGHNQLNREQVQLIERALAEADHLDKVGRDRLEQAMRQIEKSATTNQDREQAEQLRAPLKSDNSLEKIAEQSRTASQKLEGDVVKQQVNKALTQAAQLEQVSKEKILQAIAKLEQMTKAVSNAAVDENDNATEKSLTETIKQVQAAMQKEANFTKAIEHLQSVFNHPSMDEELGSMLTEAKNEALKRMDQGRELAAREQITQTMQQIEQTVRPQEIYIENEQYQAVDINSKTIAVTTITEKLAQMTNDFKAMQRDITRTLDVVTKQLEQFRNQAQTQVKPLLETTIKKLDNAILRSEMMLVTDMKTERRLMQASGQLAEARKLLIKGDHRGANQIVKEVKQLIERLNFQPSETKVKHYTAVNEKQQPSYHKPSEQFTQQLNETVNRTPIEGSARAMFDMVRSVGLNRDNEMANLLASNRHIESEQEETQQNIKSALLKLMKTEEEGSRTSQLANQALTNVTGQQLLSRTDHQGNMQNMFFNLPFLLQEKVQNLQVFVNSRNEGDKVDWENCQLYFLMETPRMGEIGIMVQASERQLSVTLKNNDANFEEKMKPLIDTTIDRLAEIGYVIKDIKYAPLTIETSEETGKEPSTPSQRPIFTKEGFDFKV